MAGFLEMRWRREEGPDNKGAQGNFAGDRNVQGLEWNGHTSLCICQDSFRYLDVLFYIKCNSIN